MTTTDATHDPALRSWVESANAPDTDFPIQNLPYARFRPRVQQERENEPWRIGVAIGDQILDLRKAQELCPWSDFVPELLRPLAQGDLTSFMTTGPQSWRRLRAALSEALTAGSMEGAFLETCLVPQSEAEYSMPCFVGDYTDFYIGIHHARAIGKLFRPDNALLPNYQWVPIGYHGRASSLVISGTPVRRPVGQTRAADAAAPVLQPSRRLDHELELGALVARGNELGTRVGIDKAEQHLFGLVLLNDWSARDVQAWEYQPLGPFLSKSFASTISPWVVTLDALAPFRRPFTRPEGDPQPLPYLDSEANRAHGAFGIELEVWLQTAQMQKAKHPGDRLMRSNFADAAYWTLAQLVAHHTVNGCNLGVGDLLGTGTLSGPEPGQGGSLLELTGGGKQPILLSTGEQRTFLEDGDTLILRGQGVADGARRIGFGDCRGTILPAL
jgi:fumarylacetoacetase